MTNAKPPAALLTARGLHHAYGGNSVLAIDNLAIARGDIALLTGDNGSGKSTLLRALAGLLQPSRCDFFDFAGQPRAAPPAAVYLHQTPYLFAGSVRANVQYGLRCCALPLERAEEAMHWAGVSSLAEAPATLLSGGEQRRVALARIRALRPQLYLLDEPLTHLDSSGKQRVRDLIATLQQENATAIISSHHTDLPATKRWLLQNGRLTISDAPSKTGD